MGSINAKRSTTLVIVYCLSVFDLLYLFITQLDSAYMRPQMQAPAQFKFALYRKIPIISPLSRDSIVLPIVLGQKRPLK